MSNSARQAERRREWAAECEAREAAEQEKNEKYRYLPAYYRTRDDLIEAFGQEQAELIHEHCQNLIREMVNSTARMVE